MKASSKEAVIATPRGLERLQRELDLLRGEKRRDIALRLHEVAADGELAENAAYEVLKAEQAFVEGRIAELEDLMGRARVVQPCQDTGVVSIGSTVELQTPQGLIEHFRIVGVSEADPRAGLISYASPLGKALLDQKCGDDVSFITPDGEMCYRILAILPVDTNS